MDVDDPVRKKKLVRPRQLGHYKRGGYEVWFTFVPMDEKQPYEVEYLRGVVGSKTRHSIREEAAANFRSLVLHDLKSV